MTGYQEQNLEHTEIYHALLEADVDAVVFVDCDHIVRYMNQCALQKYKKDLVGQSIFDCHNEQSNTVMREIFKEMKNGLPERLITDNDKQRIYMRSVRDAEGRLLGYYERYEHKA
jgi:DUF438 domain-containing protein